HGAGDLGAGLCAVRAVAAWRQDAACAGGSRRTAHRGCAGSARNMIQTRSLGVNLGEDACVWVDLCRPDAQELTQASGQVGFRVPDRGNIGEIEFTSRVRNLGEVLFLNVP